MYMSSVGAGSHSLSSMLQSIDHSSVLPTRPSHTKILNSKPLGGIRRSRRSRRSRCSRCLAPYKRVISVAEWLHRDFLSNFLCYGSSSSFWCLAAHLFLVRLTPTSDMRVISEVHHLRGTLRSVGLPPVSSRSAGHPIYQTNMMIWIRRLVCRRLHGSSASVIDQLNNPHPRPDAPVRNWTPPCFSSTNVPLLEINTSACNQHVCLKSTRL